MIHKKPSAWRGLLYYLRCLMNRKPNLVNLEITKKCNARCGFCTCWQVDSSGELKDYGPAIAKFKPVVCSVSGGEPLMRKDYAEVLSSVRPHCHYLVIITNGALLNEESAKKLVHSGVDQISVSLDYLSTKHDEARRIKGLFQHVSEIVPNLAKQGCRIVLNTVIMESNLDEIIPIAYQAKKWGVLVSYSSYCSLKSDKDNEMVGGDRFEQLAHIVEELKCLKRTLKCIKNSDHYLDRIPQYFKNGSIPNCQAGYKWLQLTPDGYVQQCSELPRICHYSEFSRDKISPVACTKCWYTCRGEAEAHFLKPKRLIELIRA